MAMAVVAALSLAVATPAQSPEPLVRPGPHFVVHWHSGALPAPLAARLADEALATAESVWPRLEELLSLRTCKPATIHVYADDAPFRAIEKQHSSVTVPVESLGRLEAQEAHVLLWPHLSKQALEIVGLPSTTSQAIVLRAAQLVAAQYAPTAARDPWLAEVFAYAVLESLVNPRHQFGLEPAYDTRRAFLYQCMEERRELPLQGTVLDFEVPKTRRDLDDDEENKCLMAQMMAATAPGWARKLLGQPGKKLTARAEVRFAAVEAVLGGNWPKTEARFAKLCLTVRPVWKENGPMIARRGERLLMAGDVDHTASFHAVQLPAKGDYAVRGSFELRPCSDDAFRLQLDWDGKTMVGCFFSVGKFRIGRWATGGEWETLMEGKAPIVANRPFEAAVEVGTTIRVVVAGSEVGTWSCGERPMHGRWSVAINDCVVWIENLRIEPLAPAKK